MRTKVFKNKMLSLILVLAFILCGSVSECRYTVNAEESGVVDPDDDLEEEDENAVDEEEDEHIDLSEDESIEVTYHITSTMLMLHYGILRVTGLTTGNFAFCLKIKLRIYGMQRSQIRKRENGL